MKLTNYNEHPQDNRYMVYDYVNLEHADYFQSLLEARKVEFERFLDDESEQPRILFGVHKRFKKDANQSNFLTHAEFRNPMIKSRWWAWILLLVTFAIISLAVIGYFKSRS